jgi:exopolysaccharide biosynthesis protein
LLDTPSNVARKQDFAIAMNASYFAVAAPMVYEGKNHNYVVGNCGWPDGWHFSEGKLVSTPARLRLRSTMIVHRDGRVTLEDNVMQLPADTSYAVSGNAMMLTRGVVTPPEKDVLRHPRSAVGLSADGKTLLLLAVDGRQDDISRGVTLAELAQLFIGFGAYNAINLDGGGSTSMILKDPAIGAWSIVNRPSDRSTQGLPVAVERPVIDVIGVLVTP